jgi:hypothetical protein
MRTLIIASITLGLGACGSDKKRSPTPDEPVVEQALRTVEQRNLFGDMPSENRMLDPQFALLDGVAWLALGSGWDWPAMTRMHLPRTPSAQPALLASTSEFRPGDVILGSARSTSKPLRASVWVGRRLSADDLDSAEVNISVAGVFLDGTTEAVDLALDVDNEPLVIEDIVWYRFAAVIPEGPIGWANLVVIDDANDDLFLSGPVVVADKNKAWPVAVPRRALRANERRAIAEQQNNLRDRFRAPTGLSPRVPPSLP